MIKDYNNLIFSKYGINLTELQLDQFENYFNFLIETNKVLNLTAITDEKEVVVKHFLDSVLPFEEFDLNARIIDVGSGAGFPSLPLKILRPDLQITMIDSLNKRVSFLNNVVEKLKLKNIVANHSRAEDFAKHYREKFDIATARAVAPLNTLVEYLLPFVKCGGKAIIYKSSKLQEELDYSTKAIELMGGKVEKILNFHIEEGEIDRSVLIISKIKTCPSKYPRDKNKPKLSPIKN